MWTRHKDTLHTTLQFAAAGDGVGADVLLSGMELVKIPSEEHAPLLQYMSVPQQSMPLLQLAPVPIQQLLELDADV